MIKSGTNCKRDNGVSARAKRAQYKSQFVICMKSIESFRINS